MLFILKFCRKRNCFGQQLQQCSDNTILMEKNTQYLTYFRWKKKGEKKCFLFSSAHTWACSGLACRILLLTIPNNCSCPSYLAVCSQSPVPLPLLLSVCQRTDLGVPHCVQQSPCVLALAHSLSLLAVNVPGASCLQIGLLDAAHRRAFGMQKVFHPVPNLLACCIHPCHSAHQNDEY